MFIVINYVILVSLQTLSFVNEIYSAYTDIYIIKLTKAVERSEALSSATQHAISPKFYGKRRTIVSLGSYVPHISEAREKKNFQEVYFFQQVKITKYFS